MMKNHGYDDYENFKYGDVLVNIEDDRIAIFKKHFSSGALILCNNDDLFVDYESLVKFWRIK